MLRRDLGIDVDLETGPYGSFKVFVDQDEVVDAGNLAFLGVLPSLRHIRERVEERMGRSRPPADA